METLAEYYTKRKYVFLEIKFNIVFMKISLTCWPSPMDENYMNVVFFEYKYDEK